MEALAFACWGIYLLLGVIVRAAVQWRRTGSTGIHGIGGTAVERVAGAAFVLGNVLGAAAPAAGAPGDTWIPGLLLFGAGLAGLVASQYAMESSWRIGVDAAERTELVTDGPFGVVRNPIFSAMFILQAGLVLIAPNVLALAAWLTVFLSVRLQVVSVEEPYLERAHGEAYRAYRARVGRFLPGIGRGE